jgi:acetyltransferase-like isoleucine patch superfamily enzyme
MLVKRYFTAIHVFMALFGQLIGSIVVGLALLPSYYLFRMAWGYVSQDPGNLWRALLMCLAIGLAFFLAGNMLMVSAVLTRIVLRIRNEEVVTEFRKAPVRLWNNAAHSFLMNLLQNTFLPLVRTTPLIVWFYRAMGAKIGPGTLMASTRLFDLDLIEIGKGCVIGGGVSITAHSAEKGQGYLLKVTIGDRVTIGADTVVMPGATIEDNVIVGANSVIPKGMRLEANSIYAGVPVKKLAKAIGELPD